MTGFARLACLRQSTFTGHLVEITPRFGADNLCRAALADEFANASGKYFDNDAARFAQPYPATNDAARSAGVMEALVELANL